MWGWPESPHPGGNLISIHFDRHVSSSRSPKASHIPPPPASSSGVPAEGAMLTGLFTQDVHTTRRLTTAGQHGNKGVLYEQETTSAFYSR